MQKLGKGLEALGMGSATLGATRYGEVGTAMAGDAYSLRSGMETGWREWCLAFSVIS